MKHCKTIGYSQLMNFLVSPSSPISCPFSVLSFRFLLLFFRHVFVLFHSFPLLFSFSFLVPSLVFMNLSVCFCLVLFLPFEFYVHSAFPSFTFILSCRCYFIDQPGTQDWL